MAQAIEAEPLLADLPRDQASAATVDQVGRAHDPRYVSAIVATGQECEASNEGAWLDADTYIGPGSLEAALHSAGGAIDAVRAALGEPGARAFSMCRPPGHHATPTRAMGFCLFNNIAVAACHALDSGLDRVAIVDFDVHHGNGTQDIFYERGDVLYMSSHQYPWYPGTGAANETGDGAGAGRTVNAPMSAGCGAAEYLEVFDDLFAPALQSFRPELLLVSAGYDAHADDPLGGMRLRSHDFATLTARIQAWCDELCEGRSAWVLEGGYSLRGLSESVVATLVQLA